MASESQIRIDFCTSPFNHGEAVEFSRSVTVEGPPSRLNVRVHVRSDVHAGASPEALGATRHQLLWDVSPPGRGERVVIRPLDEELGSSVFHGLIPE